MEFVDYLKLLIIRIISIFFVLYGYYCSTVLVERI